MPTGNMMVVKFAWINPQYLSLNSVLAAYNIRITTAQSRNRRKAIKRVVCWSNKLFELALEVTHKAL